ncbi:hypothetical protein [Sphingomonas panacisoli]|uniref:hypothetical protein n=1 Tax=Sphingomonas panacisoli TaxID=1813879 RepID=UPI0016441A7F|nr:hypothetical protein [Sphingomonas panacisoli]
MDEHNIRATALASAIDLAEIVSRTRDIIASDVVEAAKKFEQFLVGEEKSNG